jgi:hypothetical protein
MKFFVRYATCSFMADSEIGLCQSRRGEDVHHSLRGDRPRDDLSHSQIQVFLRLCLAGCGFIHPACVSDRAARQLRAAAAR